MRQHGCLSGLLDGSERDALPHRQDAHIAGSLSSAMSLLITNPQNFLCALLLAWEEVSGL
jgi:hypothetical protein